ncbi:MAG: putative toxin-antitoxin system toxin component, PIN family [Acidobacteria bacterium]|nr:putative toxin-antitoxin system toxin component, PIN family [Acidobacteriota bacterium]
MRFVFDTNVLVSALLLSDSKPRKALDLALLKGNILLSYAVLAELYDVLSRKHLQRYLDEDDIQTFIAALTREAEWVDVAVHLTACRDAKDDKFLELAVSGRATHIITGDSDLLVLNPFQGVKIISPAAFLSD